jgi:mRNA-degrading endonuclease RelE of RelBE toxin-antitoxin system
MSFSLVFARQFQKNFKRLTKKNSVLRDAVLRRIREIDSNPSIGEHLTRNLAGKQSVHVMNHWVIIYEVFIDENRIEFQNFDHHDYAYGA